MEKARKFFKKRLTRYMVGLICLVLVGPALLALEWWLRAQSMPAGLITAVHTMAIGMIGSGFLAVMLKLLAMEGYFYDAVAEVSTSKGSIERLSDDRRRELWHDLTSAIYLPGMEMAATNGGSVELKELAKSLRQAVARNFNYDVKFYIRESNRTVKFKWADESRRIMQVEEKATMVIVPFFPGERITWRMQTTGDLGAASPLIGGRINKCYFDDTKEKVPYTIVETGVQGQMTVEFTPPVRSEYQIYRDREVGWDVHAEPLYAILSPYVCRNARITLTNNAEGTTIVLREIGRPQDVFDTVGSAPHTLAFGESVELKNSVAPILPNQGFSMYFRTA